MEAMRFDALIRSIESTVPRRSAIGGLVAGLVALLGRPGAEEADAKKHKKKKKKKKNNGGGVQCQPGETNCGGQCFNLANDAQHCGSCDKSCGTGESCFNGQCLTGIGTCAAADNFCNSVLDVCNDNDTCQCLQTFAGQTRCGLAPAGGFLCGQCSRDAECNQFGAGAFCAQGSGGAGGCSCAAGVGFCNVPCPFDAGGNPV
jgi:Stigma-specific protein, Stig1